MQNISAVVLTKNEEPNIKFCLDSLKWCDEVVIIDDNSTDETIETAKKMGSKVYKRSLDNFSSQRNFGISKTSRDWVLFIDADERVSDALSFEISNVITNWLNGIENMHRGFYIPRSDIIWGKELKHGDSGVKLLRLAKRNAGEWKGIVHEKWKIKGNIGTLRNSIIHYPHQTVTEFLKEINFYTTLRARDLYLRKIKTNIFLIFFYPVGKFLLNYFFKKGILDGIPGLVQALLMSFHSFLVRSKLWTIYSKV